MIISAKHRITERSVFMEYNSIAQAAKRNPNYYDFHKVREPIPVKERKSQTTITNFI